MTNNLTKQVHNEMKSRRDEDGQGGQVGIDGVAKPGGASLVD